jgi:hypothetical protein
MAETMKRRVQMGDVVQVSKKGDVLDGAKGIVSGRKSNVFRVYVKDRGTVFFKASELLLVDAKTMQPVASADATPGGIHDMQCKCGYMASEHDADGNCPGDGYVGQPDADPMDGVGTVADELLRAQNLNELLLADIATLQAALAQAEAERDALAAALVRIRDHKMDDFRGVEAAQQADMLKMEFGMIQRYVADVLRASAGGGGAVAPEGSG